MGGLGSMARRLGPVLAALALAWLCFAWLDRVNPPFSVTDDGIRDQLLVRDCIELGRCHLIGAPTRLEGAYQGAVWLELLAAVGWAGGDTADQRIVVLALLALAVATLFVVAWRWLLPALALPAALAMAAALAVNNHPSLLVNASAAPFPDTVVAAALLCHALSGRTPYLMMAAFGLGAAVNVHVGAASLAPALVVVALLASPRPWRALFAAAAVLLATCYLTSSAALRHNLLAVGGDGRLIAASVGGAVLTVAVAAAGPAFRRRSWNGRAWIVGLLLIAPFAVASLWLIWRRHPFAVSYLHPILAPAAALAAALLSLPFELAARRARPLRWIPSAAALLAVGFAAWTMRAAPVAGTGGADAAWSLAAARAIAARTDQLGWSYEDLVFRLQSPACRELLAAMSVAAPPPAVEPRQGRAQVQVLRLDPARRAAVPPGEAVVELGGEPIAVVRQVDAWLDLTASRACRKPAGAEPARCADAALPPADERDPKRFLFSKRSLPELHGLDLAPPYLASYEIPLFPIAGSARDIAVLDPPDAACAWRITRLEGVRVETALPAARVRIHADGSARARLTIEKAVDPARCPLDDARYPPCLFESQPDDPLLAMAVAR